VPATKVLTRTCTRFSKITAKSSSRSEDNLLPVFNGRGYSPVPLYTNRMAGLLRLVFSNPPYPVEAEWRPMLREEVRRWRGLASSLMYSPAIDLAVGPFATDRQYVDEFDLMVAWSRDLLLEMVRYFKLNLREFRSHYPAAAFKQMWRLNPNSRCFLAIEIERRNRSMKYLEGSMFNPSVFGRIGVLVAWDRDRLRDLLRARENFVYFNDLGKNSFRTENLLILDRDQFAQSLERAAQSREQKGRRKSRRSSNGRK
jgi:hypothetical protein